MKLIGLLCWYDEPARMLIACIKGLRDAGVTHLVAVDGAYALYPDAKAASDPVQQGAIVTACRELGMTCTLHVPAEPWQGNEVEKRGFLFELGWTVADEGDWFWVQDADQIVTRWPTNLLDVLASTEADAAEVEFVDVVAQRAQQKDWPERFVVRSLFRAQPIKVGPAHCNYWTADGRSLWNGSGNIDGTEPLDLSGVVEVEHRPDVRPHERQAAKMQFYALRDDLGIERGDCHKCGERAARLVAYRWRMSSIGPVAEWHECCEACAVKVERRSEYELRALGVDPESVRVENRNGRIPQAV